MADADDDEGTKIGGAPPPRPKLPAAAAPAPAAPAPPPAEVSGDTHIGGGPPKRPGPPQTPAAAQSPPPAAPAAEDDDEAETQFIEVRRLRSPHSLQRVRPAGHTQIIYLDRAGYRLGRAEGCDIALYSPIASRQHAQLTRAAQGWVLEAVEGKLVLADGERVTGQVALRHHMRLQFGDDELIFHDETAIVAQAAPPATDNAARGPAVPGGRRWLLWTIVVVALAAALVALWLLAAPVASAAAPQPESGGLRTCE